MWVGGGGEVDVPCGVKFRVIEVDGDECRCLCLDESIVEKAKRLEVEKVLKRAAGDRLSKKFLGVSFFVLELGYFDAWCCRVGLAPTRSGRRVGETWGRCRCRCGE